MEEKEPPRRINSLSDRTEIVESAPARALKRGDFDDLPGMGKPLRGLHNSEDPDWWIKQKLDSEDISGVAPAAFQLRKENAVLEDTLDEFARESDVRAYLAGFNARVREAIMDLRGGPPVFTPPRDIDAEVIAWRARRVAAREAAEGAGEQPGDAKPAPDSAAKTRWWHRWRRRR